MRRGLHESLVEQLRLYNEVESLAFEIIGIDSSAERSRRSRAILEMEKDPGSCLQIYIGTQHEMRLGWKRKEISVVRSKSRRNTHPTPKPLTTRPAIIPATEEVP